MMAANFKWGAEFLFLALLCVGTATCNDSDTPSIEEQSQMNFSEAVQMYGYPAEIYQVVTADGYILSLYRIPHGLRCGPEEAPKIPVLLMHGLMGNAFNWITLGPDKSLGFILADNCYDVWLGNNRGTFQSPYHISLTTSDRAYWMFTWHEMGKYDLPAYLDFILAATNQSALHYVGHSQGTTQFFVFNSLYPEFTHKIRSFHALAPVVFVTNTFSPILRFDLVVPFYEFTTFLTGPQALQPTTEVLKLLGSRFCREHIPFGEMICSNLLFLICGYDSVQLNTTLLPIMLHRDLGGSSTLPLAHYIQNGRLGGFMQFRYPPLRNILFFGSFYPPSYNLRNVKAPVALYYSANDWLINVKDVHRLAAQLPNLVELYLVPFEKFNHIDFVWANDVKPLVYDRLLEVMKRY